jgi:hypothetical protein
VHLCLLWWGFGQMECAVQGMFQKMDCLTCLQSNTSCMWKDKDNTVSTRQEYMTQGKEFCTSYYVHSLNACPTCIQDAQTHIALSLKSMKFHQVITTSIQLHHLSRFSCSPKQMLLNILSIHCLVCSILSFIYIYIL